MNFDNFYSYAKPFLESLENDPNQEELVPLSNPTNFPNNDLDWNVNQLVSLESRDGFESTIIDYEVDAEDLAAARSARPMVGLDVLAFYKSFRYIDRAPFRGKWGIFLLDAGVLGLTQDILDLSPRLPRAEAEKLAADILIFHERYHFWIDTWSLGMEIAPLKPPKLKRYEYYVSSKRTIELTDLDYEESLANYYVFRRLGSRMLSNGKTAKSVLRKILLDSPIPYSDCFFDTNQRTYREGILAVALANGRNTPFVKAILALEYGRAQASVLSSSIQPANIRHPISGWHNCPLYMIKTTGYAKLVSHFQGPKLKEFKKFVVDYLDGRELKSSDHQYYQIDNLESIKIPNPHDKEIRGYELKSTLIKAGMTQKEFFDARKSSQNWTCGCPRKPIKPPLK